MLDISITKIKLCGIKRQEDVDAVNLLEPDYVGFVFAKKSTRFLSLEKALELREKLKKSTISVGVFKDNPLSEVIACLNSGAISMAQLHGKEDENYISKLRETFDGKIIKAFGINDKADIFKTNESTADYILLDTPGGGTGKIFDHELLNLIERPFFLAGGLDCYNVKALIKKYHPFCVDVSSNIETNGLKDKSKMKAFVEAVRERD